jgi:hypothetical protein
MSWIFQQSTGNFFDPSGKRIDIGYSGMGLGKDNPEMEDVQNIGPLPIGKYIIGDAINGTHLGPMALPLTPVQGNIMFGRSGFFIHADSVVHPGQASEGCIVLSNAARSEIDESVDKTLEVII